MIGREFSSLKVFKNLTTLYIRGDLVDCGKIMKYLPQLKNLYIDSFKTANYIQGSVDCTGDGNNEYMTQNYPNLKKLTLNNYTPSRDEELGTIMKMFTSIEQLTIFEDDSKNTSIWLPTTSAHSPITRSFFRYLQKIPEYQISAKVKDEFQLVYEYLLSAAGSNIKKDAHKISITLDTNTDLDSDPNKVFLEIKKNTGEEGSRITLKYYTSNRESHARIYYRIMNTFYLVANLEEYFQEINFSSSSRLEDAVVVSFGNLFMTRNSNARQRSVALRGLIKHTHMMEAQMSKTELDIVHNDITEDTFRMLPFSPPYTLNALKFVGCKFKNTDSTQSNQINITMPEVIVNSLQIFNSIQVLSDSKIPALTSFDALITNSTTVLISIASTDERIKKYWVSTERYISKYYNIKAAARRSTKEINEQEFMSLIKASNSKETIVIFIQFKSIKQFTLATTPVSGNIIDISLP